MLVLKQLHDQSMSYPGKLIPNCEGVRGARMHISIIKRVALQSGRIGMANPVGMESSFQSGWNGIRSFHSVLIGMAILFRPDLRAHSLPAGMEWSHSIPTRME